MMRSVVLLAILVSGVAAADPPAALRKEVVVQAPIADVWTAWSTGAGAQTFFAPRVDIELAAGGRYEVLFAPDAPPGQRGAEGLHVLAYVPGEMLAFEWSAPPAFPEIREQGASTFVVVQLAKLDARRTRVVLNHLGWGRGGDWDKVYAYFDRAWGVVLGRLQTRFARGRAIDFATE
jgi:uncharacterized protein YndB with AHSA1/START domain